MLCIDVPVKCILFTIVIVFGLLFIILHRL